jgi:predicted CxxxxCH...CXXCH cytochrome family protein
MSSIRISSLALAGLLAAVGCGKSRSTPGAANGLVTLPGGAADGTDVTVESRWCTRCHGNASLTPVGTDAAGVAFAPPVDASGASSGAKVGAHQAHLRGGTLRATGVDCASCHVVPATADKHVPGVGLRDLAALRLAGGPVITPLYDPATGKCSNVYCHGAFNGGNAAEVTWTGGAPACGSCHPIPPLVKTDGTTAHTTSTNCQSCHDGYTQTSVNAATHLNGSVEAAGCAGCHGDATRQNGDMVGVTYDPLQTASPPLDVKGNTVSVTVGVHLAHVNPSSGGVYKPIACTECHPDNTVVSHPTDPSGNTQAEVTFANATGADQAGYSPNRVLGNRTSTPTTCSVYCHDGAALGAGYAGSVVTWTWTGAAATCGSCHADPPSTLGHTSAGVTSSTNCGNCHPGYTATTVDVTLHINGQLDGGESTGGLNCGNCHAPIFNAMNGTVAKNFKHSLGAVAGTNDSPTDAGAVWGNPLTTITPANRSCVQMCHGDHPHDLTSPTTATHEGNVYEESTSSATRADGSVDRIGPGGTGTVNRNRTDFDATATAGGLCDSCHRNPIAAGRPSIDKATFAASPHGLQTTTNGTDTYSWEFRNHTTTGTANAFLRNCTKCHASPTEGTTPTITVASSGANSVHFSDNQAILAGKYNPAGSGTGGFVCFNCHGSTAHPTNGQQGDRSGVILQSRFAQASNHPVLSDAVHDTNAEAAAAYNDGSFKGANRHVNCLDCHAPHAAGATLHTVGSNALAATSPLNGQTGVAFTPPATNWATTGSGNFAAAANQPATKEYQVCFKCHSSFAFGASPAVGQSGLTETDVAQDFNPNNHSVHPVVGPNTYWPLNQAAARLGGQWTAGVGATMFCADCHGSESNVGAQGPHGSASTFILKGTSAGAQTYWPTNASGNYYELGGTVTGLFCLNCHPNLNSTTSPNSNTLHRNSNHRGNGFACIDCHVRVPHGGKIPRLLITNTGGLPSRLKDPNAWATSGRTPAWPGNTPPTAFARSNTLTSDMGTSQCTACGEHTCNSGTYTCESW